MESKKTLKTLSLFLIILAVWSAVLFIAAPAADFGFLPGELNSVFSKAVLPAEIILALITALAGVFGFLYASGKTLSRAHIGFGFAAIALYVLSALADIFLTAKGAGNWPTFLTEIAGIFVLAFFIKTSKEA